MHIASLGAGNALKFYASVRLDTRRKEILPDNVGINVRVKVVKNKVAAPFKVVNFDILFGTGIDALGCLIDAADDLDIIEKKGSWYAYKGKNIAQGKLKTAAYLAENPSVKDEVEELVRAKLTEDPEAVIKQELPSGEEEEEEEEEEDEEVVENELVKK